MCGIVGHIHLTQKLALDEVKKACIVLKHRGPDGEGAELITNHLTFGHTRLSFLDLAKKGDQPMFSTDQNLSITFNGEIYNYLKLKEILKEDYSFSTETDTEVLLAAYERWGIKMLDKLEGMFAFAIHDKKAAKLFLVRDPFGIKPLYYYLQDDQLIFASELKALSCFSSFKQAIDWTSFCDYFVYRYVPSPKTIWQNTHKVPPAHYIEFDTSTLKTKEVEYWTPEFSDKKVTSKELTNFVDDTLTDYIMKHARADVPIGSFLSGGYDSSAIVNYLVKNNYRPKTFSIGFENWQKSEDYFAKIVADHLKVENETVVANGASLEKIALMPQVYDEPIADISIIPTYMVSQLARKSVKAVMSGEGADELFGGYHWQKEYYNLNHPKKLLDKIKVVFQNKDPLAFYAKAMSMGNFDAEELKKMLTPNYHDYINKDLLWFYKKHLKKDLSPLKTIQYLDLKCFMAELVLTKVDRASMANSLEVRVPFLKKSLFEKIFHTAEQSYFKPEETKHLLYQNIKNDLPNEILARNKQGFVGPDSYYMDKSWYQEQLKNSILVERGVIKRAYIDNLLAQDYDWRIWKILVMEKWFAKWGI
jgi:asparagine synthase (glutamine-hydrolysing)